MTTSISDEVARSIPSVPALLAAVDEKPASYVKVWRDLQKNGATLIGLRPLQIAMVSTFTLDLLVPYLGIEGARRGLLIHPLVAPFGQLEQQLLDGESEVYQCSPEVVIIAVRVEDCAPSLSTHFLGLSSEQIDAEIDAFVGRVGALIAAVRQRSDASVLVWNQAPPHRLAAGVADSGLDTSQSDAIATINRRLAGACRGTSGASVFDVCRVACEVGLAQWEDPKLRLLARAPLSAAGYVAAAKHLARVLRARVVSPCKCLVLDLDNTLWGGVLGEDGVGGVTCGEDYPGNVFLEFQRRLVAYRDRGVLLAIASKNNATDVAELFRQRTDMALRLNDFAAQEIHWMDKAESLKAIAHTLNLGVDALAFFDDSPVEREWIRSRLPMVHVIDVPQDPMDYPAALESSGAFDTLVLTREDRMRTAQYQGAKHLRALAQRSSSVEEFLRSLQMHVHFGRIDESTLPRVTQLIGKTNQFNLTSCRHTQTDVERMILNGALAVWMRVHDRYADNGLVGVALAQPDGEATFVLDTFLMSCRVLGRRLESAMLDAVARRARARGAATLLATFVATAKNAPAADFLPAHGFERMDDGRWSLNICTHKSAISGLFELIDES
jgi:FkbH-like protein